MITEKLETEKHETQDLCIEEIIRETEHYYLGELQQEQRASWLLATNGVLLAIVGGATYSEMFRGNFFTITVMGIAILAFLLSSCSCLFTILPFRGIRIKFDLFGNYYRTLAEVDVARLVEDKFKFKEQTTYEDYKKRIFFHYRSHLLRNTLKSYGVFWASLLLIIGLFAFAIGTFQLLI